MSQRYKGAVISATPPTVSATSPNAYGTAKGVWTLQQQLQYEGAGTWPSPFTPIYVEDVFSTYLYVGNNSLQTITNNIDLSTKGGMIWIKPRTLADWHNLWDTARGLSKSLCTNVTNAEFDWAGEGVDQLNTNGFRLDGSNGQFNDALYIYSSWTFAKQPKFFDVVTYVGNGTSNRQIPHSLGSTPGCVIVKRYSSTTGNFNYDYWKVYHRSIAQGLSLNSFDANDAAYQPVSAVSDTTITLANATYMNTTGVSFVVYLFAHDAGGFGNNGSDNIISCDSFTTNSSGIATTTLGWEPQWILAKNADANENWFILDNMRGWNAGASGERVLSPNLSDAESAGNYGVLTSTGASWANLNGNQKYIYIAIRRGPMKTPTSGTTVFNANATAGEVTANNKTTYRYNAGFPIDLIIQGYRGGSSIAQLMVDRLRGFTVTTSSTTGYLSSSSTNIEGANSAFQLDNMQGVTNAANAGASSSLCGWMFRRAPSVFDIVCYTGDGSTGRQISHNLGVAPELIISRIRNEASSWSVYSQATGFSKRLIFNTDAGFQNLSIVSATSATTYTVGTAESLALNTNGFNFVAYLFATCAGVSKVSSYTGTGTTLQVNCGFTNGARFVMIKRTDDTAVGDWYVWDSARGITSGNDPYLLMNSSSAEVTGTDYINTYSAGFEITNSAPAAINANGGTYIYLAIA